MTYEEVREVIALYANDVLPLFADRWGRFPTRNDAEIILERLGEVQEYYEDMGDFSGIDDKINSARIEIIRQSLI